MQAWVGVMIAVVAVALAATVYGALHDRTLNRRRATEMLGPPRRPIPNLPTDARPPTYVTEAQARRRPEGTGGPGPGAGAGPGPSAVPGARTRHGDEEHELPVGHASADFATEPRSGRAVLDAPLVLVCEDDVETIRELLPALEHALRAVRPLVVVAPRIAKDVLGTLEVNAIQGMVPGVAVIADAALRQQLAEISGATPVDRTDRRSGWTDPATFGSLVRWTSTRSTSVLVPVARMSAAE